MKNKKVGSYIVVTLIGIAILVFGAIMGKANRDAQGILQTYPYICIGIGYGIFGHGLSIVFTLLSLKNNPEKAKEYEINEKDERLNTIRDKAKAKAYDIMVVVLGIFILTLALMNVDLTIILAIIAVYLFVVLTNIYFIGKYNKEM